MYISVIYASYVVAGLQTVEAILWCMFESLPGYSGFAHFSKDHPSSRWAQVFPSPPLFRRPKDNARVANLRLLQRSRFWNKCTTKTAKYTHRWHIDTCKHNEVFKGSKWIKIQWSVIWDDLQLRHRSPLGATRNMMKGRKPGGTGGKLRRECWKHVWVPCLSRFGCLQLLWIGEPMIHVSTKMDDPNVQ